MKVGIIGAGPAGLSCAAALASKGIDVEVFESEEQVGGLTKSIDLWGQRVDLGPHRFFCANPHVTRFWEHFTGQDYVMVDRLTRIFYNKRFFMYPVQAVDALTNLGFGTAAICVCSYLTSQLHPKGNEKNFEEWVSGRFGKKLYSIFFKTYSERLWGIPCTELDADFARQRIKGLNLMEVIKNALFGGGEKKHKTLLDRFAYPLNGAGQPYENMASYIRQNGHIHTSCNIRRIVTDDQRAIGIETADGTYYDLDYVVSSAPFTDMLSEIPELGETVRDTSRSLRYRNTTLVYLCVSGKNLFRDNWLYIHDPSVQVGRITNFSNWTPKNTIANNETILAMEYWSYDNDALWNYNDTQLISLARRDLLRTGLLHGNSILDGAVVRLHRSYPVYDSGYQSKVKLLQNAADSIANAYFIGRNGSFKYNNQDHSLLMGMLAAKNILAGYDKYNLWEVNTDRTYQEKGRQLMGK